MTTPSNKARAAALRQNATDAESLLWYHLRGKRLNGHHFRRQHRIGPYFVDFACRRAKLVVELDGSQHQERKRYDSRRDDYIRRKGYRVVRAGNEEVFDNLEGVLAKIAAALEE